MNMKNFKSIKEDIKKVYKAYNRPFVIGFSGGKDSSVVLQLVFEALGELPKKELTNTIHVMTSDTLVEMPYIINFIDQNLESIDEEAKKKNLPVLVHKLRPEVHQTFWVNLIGKGYPAPSRMFRWCTERLKIAPVDKFIKEEVSKYGEVTIAIGARKSESVSRNQVLSKKKRDALGLSKHPNLSAAFVYTPIEDLTADDVWEYLMTVKNSFKTMNRNLLSMYKGAAGGECPMVIDSSTPSCGKSRFGCWVCTLVEKDVTMENLIQSGENWMLPLLDFRDLLNETQDPKMKAKYRSYKRRNGRATLVRDKSKLSYGPYKMKYRKLFLKTLLECQEELNESKPDMNLELITFDELEYIRKIWRDEEHDWEDSVPKIYKDVVGEFHDWLEDDGIKFLYDDFEMLDSICKDENVPTSLIAKLIDVERKFEGLTRRSGILNNFEKVFSEEWRSEEEVIKNDVVIEEKEREMNNEN